MESEIIAALLGNTSTEALAKLTLRKAVQNKIFCPYSGVILDVRKAVVIDATESGGSPKIYVMDGKVFDEVGEKELLDTLAKAGHDQEKIQIIDGRNL